MSQASARFIQLQLSVLKQPCTLSLNPTLMILTVLCTCLQGHLIKVDYVPALQEVFLHKLESATEYNEFCFTVCVLRIVQNCKTTGNSKITSYQQYQIY